MKEVPGQQVMILAHNKNLLKYLYDAIEHRALATVGYYVGGMKEVDLKKSELKQVIIATYAMAAEALDIKTLTTLILATPKTDVVQAVGRILRVKHDRPLVIDIIDSHDVFMSQWQKRRKYYASNNYVIDKGVPPPPVKQAHDGKKDLSKVETKLKTKSIKVDTVNPSNLLGKGVAAAAKYINAVNVNAVNVNDIDAVEDYEFTSHSRCYIKL